MQSATVLLIDDDPVCIALLTRFLSVQGYEIRSAKNSEQAIEMIAEDQPDLIVTDISLPGMDGLTLLKLLRQKSETNSIPVIVLTAQSSSDDRLQSLSAGANALIVKPFQLSELLAHIQSLLQSYALMRQSVMQQTSRKLQVPSEVKLTNAELAVAKLVAQGLSNFAISQQLVTSKRTVESHISHMLRKTGLNNRTELTRWILENELF